MKPEAQRIAIGVWFKTQGGKLEIAVDEDGAEYEALPDYLNDLNAMHEVEGFLSVKQRELYVAQLHPAQLTHLHFLQADFICLFSTASQRAEALLRTIGKWTDDA